MDITILKNQLQYGDMKIIAERADVSFPTVSKVFNHKKVGADYKVKVIRAATALLSERQRSLEEVENKSRELLDKLK